jgi:hypothetical protein
VPNFPRYSPPVATLVSLLGILSQISTTDTGRSLLDIYMKRGVAYIVRSTSMDPRIGCSPPQPLADREFIAHQTRLVPILSATSA